MQFSVQLLAICHFLAQIAGQWSNLFCQTFRTCSYVIWKCAENALAEFWTTTKTPPLLHLLSLPRRGHGKEDPIGAPPEQPPPPSDVRQPIRVCYLHLRGGTRPPERTMASDGAQAKSKVGVDAQGVSQNRPLLQQLMRYVNQSVVGSGPIQIHTPGKSLQGMYRLKLVFPIKYCPN